jgi:hypothetical protein
MWLGIKREDLIKATPVKAPGETAEENDGAVV